MSLKKLYILFIVLFSQNIIFAQNYTSIPNLQFELALKQEAAEAIDSLNWKWWKKDEDD